MKFDHVIKLHLNDKIVNFRWKHTDAPGPLSVVGDTALTFTCDDEDALVAGLEEMTARSRENNEAMAEAALGRLGEEYSLSVMMRKLRALPPAVRHAPLQEAG